MINPIDPTMPSQQRMKRPREEYALGLPRPNPCLNRSGEILQRHRPMSYPNGCTSRLMSLTVAMLGQNDGNNYYPNLTTLLAGLEMSLVNSSRFNHQEFGSVHGILLFQIDYSLRSMKNLGPEDADCKETTICSLLKCLQILYQKAGRSFSSTSSSSIENLQLGEILDLIPTFILNLQQSYPSINNKKEMLDASFQVLQTLLTVPGVMNHLDKKSKLSLSRFVLCLLACGRNQSLSRVTTLLQTLEVMELWFDTN
jgi:hypothetical protein